MKAAIIVAGSAAIISVIAAFYLKTKGYPFVSSMVKAFLASAGVIGTLYSIFFL